MDENQPEGILPSLSGSLRLSSVSDETHFDLEDDNLIGREIDCTIRLSEPHISRYHAKISLTKNKQIFLEDLNSANGTYLNGRRISGRMALSLGDEIRFDDIAYRLTSVESGSSDATVIMSRDSLLAELEKNQYKSETVDVTPADIRVEEREEEVANPKSVETAHVSEPGPVDDKPEPEHVETALIPEPDPVDDKPDLIDNDSTQLLSTEQLQQAASIKQISQAFKDSGSGPRLVGTSSSVQGEVFELSQLDSKTLWYVGRSKECDVSIDNPSVSRIHASISKQNGRFYLKSENEDKPFILNKMWEKTSAMLKHNDHLQLGEVELVFRLNEAMKVAIEEPPETRRKSNKLLIFLAILFVLLGVAVTLFL